MKLPRLHCLKCDSNALAHQIALRRNLFEFLPVGLRYGRWRVGHRFLDDNAMDRTSLKLVAIEQFRPAPALKYRCKFPSEIDTIADPHVHAVAAKRRGEALGGPP